MAAGPANIATSQVVVGATATLIAAARATRVTITLISMVGRDMRDPSDDPDANVYQGGEIFVGFTNAVSQWDGYAVSFNGGVLKRDNRQFELNYSGALYGIVPDGFPEVIVAVLEVYE